MSTTITMLQYESICNIIDRVKLDDKPEDTDVYASLICEVLDCDIDPDASENEWYREHEREK